MRKTELVNTWYIIKREYLERVRTNSFLVLTLLLPAIMVGAFVIPAKLSSYRSSTAKRLVVVTSTPAFGEIVREQLVTDIKTDDEIGGSELNSIDDKDKTIGNKSTHTYAIELDSDSSDAGRTALRNRVKAGEIDGYLWLTGDAVAARKVTYFGGESGAVMEQSWLGDRLGRAVLVQELAQHGVTGARAADLLKPIMVETIRLEHGRETKAHDKETFLAIFAMVTLLFTAVIFYGVSVMRAVLEEKNSRVMEVLLSSATSTQLMAGKLIGVGAVGLTQIGIWIAMAAVFAFPAIATGVSMGAIRISPLTLAAFPLFFVLGYLLYSSIYAAVGAVITSEQEGQQLQFVILLPLMIAVFMMGPVMRAPDSRIAEWASMLPFFSPVLMYLRIAVHSPPVWQIVVSLILLVIMIVRMLILCARIYRTGILMYGKTPTLPEIALWLKHAKT
jgi:ABC-2 type transport system permease protein